NVATSGRCRLFSTCTSSRLSINSGVTSAPSSLTSIWLSKLLSGIGDLQSHAGDQLPDVGQFIGSGDQTPEVGIAVFFISNPCQCIPCVYYPYPFSANAA